MKLAKTAFFLLFIAVALPVSAAQENKPAMDNVATAKTVQGPIATMDQANMKKMDATIMQMQQTRMKMQTATDPAEKKRLMHTYMQQMQAGMKMMEMMGGQNTDKMPMAEKGMTNKPVGGKEMNMESNEVHGMNKMEGKAPMQMQGGNMGMMGKMMGDEDMMNRMQRMEKKMSMMMEMMNGMMAEKEMMMK